jgi:hypothetical protein
MANIRISQLPTAPSAITGAELVPIVQNGETVQATVNQLVSSPSQTQTFLTVNNEPSLPNSRYFGTGVGIGITDSGAQGKFSLFLNGTSGSLEVAGYGLIAKTGAGTVAARVLSTSGAGLSVTNGDGISGNPTIAATGLLYSLANLGGTGLIFSNGSTLSPLSIAGTTNQINVASGNGVSGNPTISFASDAVFPGTAGITVPNGTTGQRPIAPNLGQMRYNTTTGTFEFYEGGIWQVLGTGSGTVTQVNGTANQINVVNSTTTPTVSIVNNPTLPGVGGVIIPIGTTAQRPGSGNGTLRYNSDTATFEGYANGAWGAIVSGSGVTTFNAGTTGLTPSVPSSGGIILGGTLITSNGGTGASGTLVGYVYGNGTANMTASTTIPTTNLSGTITNAQLANSSITINGNTVSLGGSTTVTASTTSTLTIGTGLTGTSFNGSVPVTIAIDSTVVTLSDTQTLTNKTLTLPVISQIVNTGTLTLPTSTDTLVGRATTDTLTNKSISGSTNTFTNIPNSALTNNSITIGSSSVSLGNTLSTLAGVSISGSANTITSIGNSSLVNSSVTIGLSSLSLGGTLNALAGVTISGATNTLTNIGNSSLTNSSVTYNGVAIALGASGTITAVNPNALTIGTGLSGTSYNGSALVTVAISNTAVTAGSYGSATQVGTFTVNAQGQLTTAASVAISIAPSQINATIPNSGLTNSSVTVGSTNIALGATSLTLAGLTSVTVTQDPTAALQLATKQYVDNIAQGLNTKAPILCATTANITLSGEQTIDSVTTSASRVLVKNQSTAANNGIYLSGSGAWTRTADANTWNQLVSAYVFVEEGTINGDTGWVCTSDPGGTLGVTAVTWVQFSGAGTYTAGTGLTLTGTQFSITNTAVTAGTYGNAARNMTLVVNAQGQITSLIDQPISIAPSQINATIPNSGLTNSSITINGSAISLGGSVSVGTVTSVAALTLGTTGTDLSSTVATGTTNPVITLNVPTASATNRGALSAADWSTFNSKAPGTTFTTNYIPYGQGTTTLNQSSSLQFDGTNLNAPNSVTTGGHYSKGAFGGTYADGIVLDYVTGNGRFSVGAADGYTWYNGGLANTSLAALTSAGNFSAIGTGIFVNGIGGGNF